MTVAVVEESPLSLLLVAHEFEQAVSGGARHLQLALGRRCLPRVAGTHVLDELQPCCALPVVFHAIRPSISVDLLHFWTALYHPVLSQSSCVDSQKGSLPDVNLNIVFIPIVDA